MSLSPGGDICFASALQQPAGGDDPLVTFLEHEGFTYPHRTATNLRLLSAILPAGLLRDLCRESLLTPVPDMALNNLERIGSAVPEADFLPVMENRTSRTQLLTVCGSSPFLTGILCRDPVYFRRVFVEGEIATARSEAESLAALRSHTGENLSHQELLPLLRRFKLLEILRIAARDLTGLASLEEVTLELSALAASCLQLAYETARRQLEGEHGKPMVETPAGLVEAEFAILGMGKFGGRELNFSSDIDIIYFYSSDNGKTTGIPDGRGGMKGVFSLHAFFVKLAEMVTKALSQVTADGFVFRVDLGLRPEGKSGEMAISVRAAEIYYESWGQTWERAALLKARPVAGSTALGEQLLRNIEPFIYRRYLDYTLIEDIMGMKKKIDASLAREMEGEYNIKLGRGGIREIEFFIQALQLVHAGKNPSLRHKNSLEALSALQRAGLIPAEELAALSSAYRFLRTVEHRIQVVQERQTHSLPKKDEELLALARRCGFTQEQGLALFRQSLEGHRGRVSEIYGKFFLAGEEKLKEDIDPSVYHFFDRAADPDLVKDMLAAQGFVNADSAYANLLLLRDGPPKAHLTERSRRLLEKISPLLLQEIFSSPDPDMALANLDRFLCAIGPRASFFALLAENRNILKLVVSLFGMSEFLSKILISHPELLDSMVAASSSVAFKQAEQMRSELAAQLDLAVDFEQRLDMLRRYHHEEFLRIGINDIYGRLGQTEITTQLTFLAEVCLHGAYGMAKTELARFGRPTYSEGGSTKEAGFAVIGMGKVGAFELNYHSDLDIIYIYDHQGSTDGEKQITNHEYFAKLGQKIISILTTPTREGYVYKIDTRLRPSGNAGPLVTSLASFKNYHHGEAQVWERQALTKARVILGQPDLADSIAEIIRHTVYFMELPAGTREEIHRLRMRMESEIAKESSGYYNIKTGRGGLVDIEFMVQYLQLLHGRSHAELRNPNTLTALKGMKASSILTLEEYQVLLDGYKFLRRLENRLRIIHDYSINDLGGQADYLNKLARRLGYEARLRSPGKVLLNDYVAVTDSIRKVYDRILGEPASG